MSIKLYYVTCCSEEITEKSVYVVAENPAIAEEEALNALRKDRWMSKGYVRRIDRIADSDDFAFTDKLVVAI